MSRLLLLAAMMASAGCYAARPAAVGVAPEIGTRMSFVVNDQGRAALSIVMGEGVERVDGQLLSRDSATYLVAVSEVRRARGGIQVWAGEPVRIADRDIRSLALLQYDRLRTSVAVASGAGAFGIILTRGLTGFVLGSESTSAPRDSLASSLCFLWP